MITVSRTKFGAKISDIYFAAHPDAAETPSTICYFVQSRERYPGFVPFRTRIIDLTQPLDSIFETFSSSTRYKIKRSEREGHKPSCTVAPNEEKILEFASFYDEFAQQKGLAPSNKPKLLSLAGENALAITAMRDEEDRLLCAHAYIIDSALARVRLLHSSSHFRKLDDSGERNIVGRANRHLHWFGMREFKALGHADYDLGGVAQGDNDPAKRAIAQFKLEFGGRPVEEYNGFVPRSMLGSLLLAVKRNVG